METKGNYVLIGAFTLAGFLGIMALLLLFARVELDRQYAYYDVRFTSVAGLSAASDVRFSGLPVGQVVDVRLSPDRDGTIVVRVEVNADTPVRTDSVATIEAQGVTGVAFVLISSGTPAAPLLEPTEDQEFPEITASRSVLQALSEDAPQLVDETLTVVTELGVLFGPDNQQRVERILRNVEGASDTFATTLEDFSDVAGSVTEFATQIGEVSGILADLSDDIEGLLQTADTTLTGIGALTDDAERVLETGTQTLSAARQTVSQAERYIAEDLSDTTADLRTAVQELRAEVASVSRDARDVMATFSTTGATATTRLTEAQSTLVAADALMARLDETVGTINAAVAQFDTLMAEGATPLIAETRAAVADATVVIRQVSTAAQEDLPVIMEDIRTATETVARVVTQVGSDVSAASGRLEGLSASAQATLTQITNTFTEANATLSAINGAVTTGDRTLAAAERAFSGADKVINEDLDGIIAGLQGSLTALNTAIGQVSADLPQITTDLRAASQSAEEAFTQLEQIAEASGPAVSEFSRSGLPLYTRLAQETRELISNLDRLTLQIQRDPARFFLDRQSPEFQR